MSSGTCTWFPNRWVLVRTRTLKARAEARLPGHTRPGAEYVSEAGGRGWVQAGRPFGCEDRGAASACKKGVTVQPRSRLLTGRCAHLYPSPPVILPPGQGPRLCCALSFPFSARLPPPPSAYKDAPIPTPRATPGLPLLRPPAQPSERTGPAFLPGALRDRPSAGSLPFPLDCAGPPPAKHDPPTSPHPQPQGSTWKHVQERASHGH